MTTTLDYKEKKASHIMALLIGEKFTFSDPHYFGEVLRVDSERYLWCYYQLDGYSEVVVMTLDEILKKY